MRPIKLNIPDLVSGYRSTNAQNVINDAVSAALENTLSRDGTVPNFMTADLDLNSNRLINVAAPVNPNDGARLIDVTAGVASVGTTTLVRYAYASADAGNSITGLDADVGTYTQVGSFDATLQAGSGAIWRAYTKTGMGTLGNVSYVVGVGIVLEGTYARWLFVVPANNELDIRAIGVLCDGTTTGQETRCYVARDWAIDNQGLLVGAGTLKTAVGFDFLGAWLNFESLKIICSSGYAGIIVTVEPHQTNLGYPYRASLWIWGNNNAFATATSETALRVLDSNASMGDIKLKVAYCSTGLEPYQDSEKKRYEVYGEYCDYLVFPKETVGGSPDTNFFYINGHNCRHWYCEEDNAQTSAYVHFNVEGRVDPGDGSAAIQIRNGKSVSLFGRIRAHNGGPNVYITKDHGVDSVHCDLYFEHGHGCAFNAEWVRRLTGQIVVHDYDVDSSPNAATTASIKLGRITDGSDFIATCTAGNNTYGIQIGDSVTGYYPINADLRCSVEMNSTTEPYLGTYTTSTGILIDKANGGSVTIGTCFGHIIANAGVLNYTVNLGTTFLSTKYTITKNSAASITANFTGGVDSSRVFGLSWLFKGVRIDNFTDYSMGGTHNGTGFIPSGSLRGPSIGISCQNSDYNLAGRWKLQGASYYDTTLQLPYYAQGSTTPDIWKTAAGGGANTVGYSTAAATYFTAIGGAPATLYANAIDRWLYKNTESGFISSIIAAYAGWLDTEAHFLVNLVNPGTHNLTKNGSPIFTAGSGVTGTAATTDYYATGYDMTSAAEGAGLNDFHLGVYTVTATTNNGYTGSANGKATIRGRNAAGAQGSVGTTTKISASGTSSQAPHHTLVLRKDATNEYIYDEGLVDSVLAASSSGGVGGMPDAIDILRGAGVATNHKLGFIHFGRAPTDNQALVLSQSTQEMGRSIGAIP